MITYETNYLAHHGILGMKWGVRKKRPSGENVRTNKQKKVEYGKKEIARASIRYKKNMIKYQKDQIRRRNKIYMDSYNKTADEYNNGKIEEFNKKNSPKSKNYIEKYEKQFSNDWKKTYNKMMMDDFTKNNRHYKKADEIAKKYGLYKVDDLAKSNKRFMDDMVKSDYSLDSEDLKKYYSKS